MNAMKRLALAIGLTAAIYLAAGNSARADEPSFDEIYNLIRTNLAGVSAMDLDHAALRGLLEELQGQVTLLTNSTAAAESDTNSPLIGASRVFDDSFAYLQLSRVEEGAASAVTNTLHTLAATNKLKGLVLDLRFARGQDYGAAVAVADLFLSEAKPVLQIGDKVFNSTAKTNALNLPLAVLVNHQTYSSAEALASVLRRNKAGLVLGSPTAGEAVVFKEFPLSNGQRLRVAVNRVKLGEGPALSLRGVRPDIAIKVDIKDEKEYLKDAYAMLARPGEAGVETNLTASISGTTNRSTRRMINEAELVRMHKEGQNIDDDTTTAPRTPVVAEKPIVRDPVLGRALDLLKGLAVVREYRAF